MTATAYAAQGGGVGNETPGGLRCRGVINCTLAPTRSVAIDRSASPISVVCRRVRIYPSIVVVIRSLAGYLALSGHFLAFATDVPGPRADCDMVGV